MFISKDNQPHFQSHITMILSFVASFTEFLGQCGKPTEDPNTEKIQKAVSQLEGGGDQQAVCSMQLLLRIKTAEQALMGEGETLEPADFTGELYCLKSPLPSKDKL